MILRLFVMVLFTCLAVSAHAHSLGVDKADLIEMRDGSYHLVSHVPPQYQPLITPPELPARCALDGNPRGARGAYEVRFVFTCHSPLTADDGIILTWRRDGAMMTVTWLGEEPVTRLSRRDGGIITLNLGEYLAGSGSFLAAAKRYTLLGIEHILLGIDHLLFVFGLLLLVRGLGMLVKTITAFTVAHSITLALATLGVVNLPSAPVEAAIALSIVFLAAEIVRGWQGQLSLTHHQPWIVAFGFGLLHGLGFAGALSEIGLPPPEIPLALLFFNIGVEVGQLLFVAAVLALIWIWRATAMTAPRWAAHIPVYTLGTIASYWFIERASGIFV